MPAQTRTMTVAEFKDAFSGLVVEVSRGESRVLVGQSGNPTAALVSADDLRRLEELDRDWEAGTKALERFGAAFADVPPEESEAEIARIIAEIRRQDDAEAEVERQPA